MATPVARLEPAPPHLLQSSTAKTDTTAAPIVAAPTATGLTSTEGVDQLTMTVLEEGLYLITTSIRCVTGSNAATSHYCLWVVTYTGTDSSAETAVAVEPTGYIADADGASLAYAPGMALKLGSGIALTQMMCLAALAGSTITLQISHAVAGACTNGGTYRLQAIITRL